jgi:tetratricopeptide (TPR) repeat protein
MTELDALTQGRHHEKAGNLAAAERCYQQALEQEPWNEEALRFLGLLYLNSGRVAEAEPVFRQLLNLNPYHAETYNDLGIAVAIQGRFDEAVAAFQQALHIQPGYATAHNNLALVLLWRKQPAEAEASARRAIELNPDFPEAFNRLGDALRAQGRLSDAIDNYRQALRMRPDFVEALNNLGIGLAQSGREDEAVEQFRRAIEIRPDYVKSYGNLGTALQNLGRFDEALDSYARALQFQPDDGQLHRNRALVWLRQGKFNLGWPEYEWRLRCTDDPLPQLAQPAWRGEPLNGRTILLHAEQGLGDAIQFIRYAPLVQARGGTVIVACPPSLVQLLTGFRGIDRLLESDSALPPFDTHAPLPSLPGIFGMTPMNVPADVPYLTADPRLAEFWGQELSKYAGFKIGIAWRGSAGYPDDNRRSAPLSVFAPLAKLPGVHVFSLQKGPGSEEVRGVSWPIIDLAGRLDESTGGFMDTAAVIKHLDLVVTVDTAIGHLAGALAVPYYLALSFVADWRWFLDREDTPWYPTARLFRQKERGNWTELFDRIAATIASR